MNNSPSCSCLPEFLGAPPNCRPECISNSECLSHLACINQKCKDPCERSCGSNANCFVVSHTPMCTCLDDYTGDPFTQCVQKQSEYPQIDKNIENYIVLRLITFTAIPVPNPTTPCTPSPCGSNAVCKELNGAGSCTCIIDYVGNPYEGCRPECILNSDCPTNQACINTKCKDPCPGTCGRNAECQVINHLPVCTCFARYTGDPFSYCNPLRIGK